MNLNKKQIKNLSSNKRLNKDMTPQVNGAYVDHTNGQICGSLHNACYLTTVAAATCVNATDRPIGDH